MEPEGRGVTWMPQRKNVMIKFPGGGEYSSSVEIGPDDPEYDHKNAMDPEQAKHERFLNRNKRVTADELVGEVRQMMHDQQWEDEKARLGITLVPRLLIGFLITPLFIFAVMSVILFIIDPTQKIIGVPR